MGGKVHFVLPTGIGEACVRAGIEDEAVYEAVAGTLQGTF